RIHYTEAGSGLPLLLIAGGGLNSTISSLTNPFDPIPEFKGEYRCIASDLRNANSGQSSGPMEIDRPWDAYTDDHLGLMDHLGVGEFMVMGFCIGGPMIHNLIRRAPERIVAAAMMQPSGFRPEMPDLFYQNKIKGWGRRCARSAQTSPGTWSMTSSPACTRTAPTSCSPCRAISYAPSGHRC